MTGRLSGKTALVTGAGSGIGRAVARRFTEEGARVYFADVNLEAAHTAVLTVGRGQAEAVHMDVSNELSVAGAFAHVAGAGSIDVVVVNAGIQLFGQDAKVGDLELEVWEKTVAVNQRGAFLTLKHAVRAMAATGGSIICTGSPTAVVACGRGFTAYTSSKAGVHGLARVAAADYAEQNIRINTVVPGYTETPLVRSISDDPQERANLIEATMLRRPGTASDLEGIMLFLASDESAYATGGLFTIDGGLTAV